MTTIRQLLSLRPNDVWTIAPTETVYKAVHLMADKNVGSLVVMNAGRLAGLVTERHYARNVILKGKTSPQTLVRDIMATKVVCARLDQTIDDCMDLMTHRRVRHLPVLSHRKVVGIVSIGDLVKSIIDEQKFTIGQLESYIAGERLVS